VIIGMLSGIRRNILVVIFVSSLAMIPIYIRSLLYFDTNPLIFRLAHLVSIVCISLILVGVGWRASARTRALLVIAWVLVLRFMIPLRLDEGIVSNYPDMIYETQIADKILASGAVSFQSPTTYGVDYVFNPMLELLVANLGMVLGVPLAPVLKYIGPFLGVLTVIFLLGFYRGFLDDKTAVISVFLAASCFHFLRFDSGTVHETLALVFFSMILYSLPRAGAAWRSLSVVAAFMLVSTHFFTSVVAFFNFLAASALILILPGMLGRGLDRIQRSILGLPMMMLGLVILWYSYIASEMLRIAFHLGQEVILVFMSTWQAIFPLSPPSAAGVSVWVRIVGDISVVAFALTASLGVWAIVVMKKHRAERSALPLAAASGMTFIIGLVLYTKLATTTDLLPRTFIYLYFLGAPLSLLGIRELSLRGGDIRGPTNRSLLICAALIALVAIGSTYYNYPQFLYDNTSPLNFEDVRLPLEDWKSAGLFARDHVSQNAAVWGDKIAFSFVGGYAQREVSLFPRELRTSLVDFTRSYVPHGDTIILRKSMPYVPYLDYQTDGQQFQGIVEEANAFYSSADVVMIVER